MGKTARASIGARGAVIEAPGPAWEAFLSAAPAADFFQSTEWAAIDEAANGHHPVVVRVGDLMGALVSLPSDKGEDAQCLYGPVSREASALPSLLDGIEVAARQAGAAGVRFVGSPLAPVSGEAFRRAGYRTTPWLTAVVDLAGPEQAIFDRITPAARKAVRRATREGVEILRCETRDQFERLFLQPFASVARPGYDPRRDAAAFEIDAGRHYAYFVAVANGEVLAVLGAYRYRGVAREIMSARTEAGRRRGLPAQDLLHWHVFLHHRRLGDRIFDLAGFAYEPRDAAEAGIRRFKEKWGGTTLAVPIHEKRLQGAVTRARRRLQRALS